MPQKNFKFSAPDKIGSNAKTIEWKVTEMKKGLWFRDQIEQESYNGILFLESC